MLVDEGGRGSIYAGSYQHLCYTWVVHKLSFEERQLLWLKKRLKTTVLDDLKLVFLLPALSLLCLKPHLLDSQIPSFCFSEPVRIKKK